MYVCEEFSLATLQMPSSSTACALKGGQANMFILGMMTACVCVYMWNTVTVEWGCLTVANSMLVVYLPLSIPFSVLRSNRDDTLPK